MCLNWLQIFILAGMLVSFGFVFASILIVDCTVPDERQWVDEVE